MSVNSIQRDKRLGNEKKWLKLMADAMSGDLAWRVTPATVAPEPTAAAWTRTVYIELVNTAGDVHEWFNDTLASCVSIADTSSAGTASVASTSVTFTNGRASVVVSGDEAAWLNAETDTLTVGYEGSICGYTLSSATSVETFTTAA